MKKSAVIKLVLSAYDLDLLIKACELTAQKAPNKLAFNRLLKMSHDLMDQKHKHDEN
jgi:hypothetical protein